MARLRDMWTPGAGVPSVRVLRFASAVAFVALAVFLGTAAAASVVRANAVPVTGPRHGVSHSLRPVGVGTGGASRGSPLESSARTPVPPGAAVPGTEVRARRLARAAQGGHPFQGPAVPVRDVPAGLPRAPTPSPGIGLGMLRWAAVLVGALVGGVLLGRRARPRDGPLALMTSFGTRPGTSPDVGPAGARGADRRPGGGRRRRSEGSERGAKLKALTWQCRQNPGCKVRNILPIVYDSYTLAIAHTRMLRTPKTDVERERLKNKSDPLVVPGKDNVVEKVGRQLREGTYQFGDFSLPRKKKRLNLTQARRRDRLRAAAEKEAKMRGEKFVIPGLIRPVDKVLPLGCRDSRAVSPWAAPCLTSSNARSESVSEPCGRRSGT